MGSTILKFFGIDDNLADLKNLIPILEKYQIEVETTSDAELFMNYMSASNRSDILLSDGLMEEIYVSLDGSSKRIAVDSETAGYSLLKKGFDGVKAKAMTRIIVSMHDLKDSIGKQLSRLQKNGENFYFISKTDINYLEKFENLLKLHITTYKTECMTPKVEYVTQILDDWFDDDDTKLAFFGVTASVESFKDVIHRKLKFDQDIVDRCDAIYRIKVNLSNVYGKDGVAKEKRWLNRPSEYLDDKSPIDLIRTGHQHELYHLLSVLEQH